MIFAESFLTTSWRAALPYRAPTSANADAPRRVLYVGNEDFAFMLAPISRWRAQLGGGL
jgi:hypothetical protein